MTEAKETAAPGAATGTWSKLYALSWTAKTINGIQTTLGNSWFFGWLIPAVALTPLGGEEQTSAVLRAGRTVSHLVKPIFSWLSNRLLSLTAASWFFKLGQKLIEFGRKQPLRATGVFLLALTAAVTFYRAGWIYPAAGIGGLLMLGFMAVLVRHPSGGLYLALSYIGIDYILRRLPGLSWLAGSWDELLFLLLIGLWFLDALRGQRYRPSELGLPVLVFIGISTFLFLVVSPQMNIAVEGWRVVIQYLLWYFIGLNLLDKRAQGKHLMIAFVLMGAALGLHAAYQFITGAAIPASWIDSPEAAAIRTRAFSIVGSPNVLGSLFVLMIPMGLGLLLAAKKRWTQLFYLAALGIMGAGLLFTYSRGALLSLAGALLVFGLLKDRRVIILLLLLAIATPVVFPSAFERLVFLTSPEYRLSSEAGGRIARWDITLERWENHPYVGHGLGRFGGAVANRHAETTWFYTDNFYLKTAAEMGLIGLTAFLWFLIKCLRAGGRAIVRLGESTWQSLGVGILAGLVGVLMHNVVENIFEVPAVASYFWLWLGILIGMAGRGRESLGGTPGGQD